MIYPPLVSVIIATHNRINSFENAINSVIEQTYPNIEIIIVDDNADAAMNELIKSIVNTAKSSYPLRYIQNDVNRGSAITRNIGIRASIGEYVTFLDDDDIYLPNKIENQVKYMLEKNSDYNITDLKLYDEKDNLIEHRVRSYIKSYDSEKLRTYHTMYHMTGTDTLMFKRDYLLKIGCFAPINVGDEFYLMQRAIEGKGRFSYLSECDVKAYIHFESAGLSSGDSKIKGENDLFEYKKTLFHSLSSSQRRYVRMRHYAVLAFAELRRGRRFFFMKYAFLSFASSPIQCMKEFLKIALIKTRLCDLKIKRLLKYGEAKISNESL